MASITSGDENKWISDTFGIHYNDNYYYFGGNDIEIEGIWEWVSGEPWVFTNWKSGEPNNDGGIEHALTWYHEGFMNEYGYLWNDRDPSQLRPSLVEWNTPIYYSNVTGHWYQINPIAQSWFDAKDSAESAGGYLASITSGDENKWISDTFGIHYNDNYYYFGGNDIEIEGIWEWVSGEPWVFTNWKSGEPNNNGGVEHALTWYHEDFMNEYGYLWNDRDPSQLRPSLVEWNRDPTGPCFISIL